MTPDQSGKGRLTAVIGGAAGGAACWAVFAAASASLPVPIRFLVAFGVALSGPGAAAALPLAHRLGTLARVILPLSLGMAATPLAYHLFHATGAQAIFPFASAALAGAYLMWCRSSPPVQGERRIPIGSLLLVVALAGVLGLAAFGHALRTTDEGIAVYGSYDAFDLSYYAAMAGELTHTVPPRSPFSGGSGFTHAYYPHLLAAAVHRAGNVPLLDLYFRYLWPAFLVVLALSAFLFVRSISSPGVAALAVALLLVGSDLSYVAVWLLRPSTSTFDDVIWSANFQSPSAEPLLFNNWTPALAVVFAALFALARDEDDPWTGWRVAAGLAIALLLQFKPFAWVALMGGLVVAALLVGSGDRAGRRRYLATIAVALAASLPLVLQLFIGAGDAQARLVVGPFLLPQMTLTKIGLARPLQAWAADIGLSGFAQTSLVTAIGLVVFLLGGLGYRLVGLPAVWGAIRGSTPGYRPIWRLMAATIVLAMAIPCVVQSVPYHETLQFHQMALFLLPVFVASAVVTGFSGWRRGAVIALLVAVSLPSTIHYLVPKWTTPRRYARLSTGEIEVAAHMATLDPSRTVVLHRDVGVSLLSIVGARRSVLAWARYVPESDRRRRDVGRFFAGQDRTQKESLEILRQYGATHVVERSRQDRIHAGVRRRLTPVVKAGGVTLYAVPALP